MSNSLSSVLAGINNGVRNGLDLYTTVQAEARARRDEQLKLDRYEIDDQRYEQDRAYRIEQDALSQANNEREFKLRERAQTFAEDEAERRAQAEERRHRETMALARARIGATNAKTRAVAQSNWLKQSKSYLQDLGKAFKGEDGLRNFVELANSNSIYRTVLADRLGAQFSPDDLEDVRLIPAGDKVVLGKLKADGSMDMWDPDGDGQAGVAIPARQMALVVGGAESADSYDLVATRSGLSSAAEQSARAIEAQSIPLGEQLNERKQSLAQAEFSRELATQGPRAEYISQQEQARAGAEVSQWDGSRRYTDPSTGREVVEMPGTPSIRGSAALQAAKQEQAAEDQRTAVALSQARDSVGITEQRIADLPRQANSLRTGWQEVDSRIRALPEKDQQSAYERSAETFDRNPTLAKLFPGEDYKTASDKMLAERQGLADRIAGAIDIKTGRDSDGKATNLTGAKANVKAVVMSMPDQVQLALRDSTGQAEGALTAAMQKAVELGKPEAAVYIMEATRRDIPAEEAVRLMQDPALVKVKDPNVRFELASQALDKVARGEASDPLSGLGMVLQR